MLELRNLCLRQGDFTLRANLEVAARGIVAVLGPSGSGKSTLLASIAGFLQPEQGQVLWNGEDLAGIPPGERPVSMVFQDQNLFPHLTAFQNVALGTSPRLKVSEADKDRISESFRRVGLEGLQDRRPSELSGGQASRVVLARALVRDRPIVCLDEPFSALGPALRDEMLDLVQERFRDRLVLMVTHDPDDAARVSQRVIVVANGAAETPQETAALLAAPPEALRSYLGTRL